MEWEGLPSLYTLALTFSIVLVLIGFLVFVIVQDCNIFGVCSNLGRHRAAT